MSLPMILALAMSLAQDPKPEPKMEAPKSEAPKQEKSPVDVWFEDGIRFKAKDGSFEGRLGGRFLAHYRDVFDRPQETVGAPTMRNVPDTIFVRQARIDLEGTIMKDWGFKVQVDFGSGLYNQSSGAAPSNVTGTLRDGFVEWKKLKEFQIRFGQWLVPLSQEDYSSSRFIDFAERSVMNRLHPGRELSLMFSGTILENSLDWYALVTNGQGTLNDGGRNINDSNDQT
jgi:phosphate-selective porin OprO and OprP